MLSQRILWEVFSIVKNPGKLSPDSPTINARSIATIVTIPPVFHSSNYSHFILIAVTIGIVWYLHSLIIDTANLLAGYWVLASAGDTKCYSNGGKIILNITSR